MNPSSRRHTPAARVAAVWLMIAAALSPLPVSAVPRFVCTLGMAQAGPACPHCHGRGAEKPVRETGTPCCRVVVDAGPSAIRGTAPAPVVPHSPISALASITRGGCDFLAVSATVDPAPRFRTRGPTPTTVLRL